MQCLLLYFHKNMKGPDSHLVSLNFPSWPSWSPLPNFALPSKIKVPYLPVLSGNLFMLIIVLKVITLVMVSLTHSLTVGCEISLLLSLHVLGRCSDVGKKKDNHYPYGNYESLLLLFFLKAYQHFLPYIPL